MIKIDENTLTHNHLCGFAIRDFRMRASLNNKDASTHCAADIGGGIRKEKKKCLLLNGYKSTDTYIVYYSIYDGNSRKKKIKRIVFC